MFFDVCTAIDKGGCGGTGCEWWGLTWERACTFNDKYMCQGDNSCPVMMWVLIIVLIGVVFHGPHGRGLNTQPSFTKGKAAPDCTHGTCNLVTFTVVEPLYCTRGHITGIRIDGKGLDPGSLMHLKLVTVTCESSSYQVFHSFYEEMRNEFSISAKAKNLFLSLAESIAQTLNVTSCYVCGGPT
jgi:hypothetical protein